MGPTAKFSADNQTVEVDDGAGPITLRIEVVYAIFEALMGGATYPTLGSPDGVRYPADINTIPSEGELTLWMDFQDDSREHFVFPAPGKTHDQVAAASEAIRKGFRMLFLANQVH